MVETGVNFDDYWYVVRGRTGSEERILREMKKLLDDEKHEPFLPKIVKPHGKKVVDENGVSKKVYEKERKLLFPGYEFIRSTMAPSEFAEEIQPLKNIEGVFDVLHYGDDENDIAVHDKERAVWEGLLDGEHCLTESMGYRVGDRIEIVSGPLKGKERLVVKINTNKRTAVIEVDVFGKKRGAVVNLDIATKKS